MHGIVVLWMYGAWMIAIGLLGRWDFLHQRQVPRSAKWMGATHSLDQWRRGNMKGIHALIASGGAMIVIGTLAALWRLVTQ
jgi:hypothetical protein